MLHGLNGKYNYGESALLLTRTFVIRALFAILIFHFLLLFVIVQWIERTIVRGPS